jgi:hypothetical protein
MACSTLTSLYGTLRLELPLTVIALASLAPQTCKIMSKSTLNYFSLGMSASGQT